MLSSSLTPKSALDRLAGETSSSPSFPAPRAPDPRQLFSPSSSAPPPCPSTKEAALVYTKAAGEVAAQLLRNSVSDKTLDQLKRQASDRIVDNAAALAASFDRGADGAERAKLFEQLDLNVRAGFALLDRV